MLPRGKLVETAMQTGEGTPVPKSYYSKTIVALIVIAIVRAIQLIILISTFIVIRDSGLGFRVGMIIGILILRS